MPWERDLNAGQLSLMRGVYEEAERFLLSAREGASALGRADSAWADVHRALAKMYLATARPGQAAEAANEALASDENYWGTACDQWAEDAFLLGEALREQGDYERARSWFERCANFREQRYGTTHDTTLEALAKLVVVFLQSNTVSGIESLHAKTYQGFQATHPSGMWANFLNLPELAKQYAAQGRVVELQDILQREAALLRKQVGASHKEVAGVLAIEAEVLRGSQRKLAAGFVGARAQNVEQRNDLSLFSSTDRLYKLPMSQVDDAIERLLLAPILEPAAPNAVRKLRWRIHPRRLKTEPLVANISYVDPENRNGEYAEMRLTLQLQSRGPACAASFQWQMFHSSNMPLAQSIIAFTIKEIDDNLSVMKSSIELPTDFRNAFVRAEPAAPQHSWPTPQQFNEAIQNPKSNFSDPVLKASEPETNVLGLPKPYSGAFATVYRLQGQDGIGHEHARAVKCFTTRVPDQQQRYAEISNTLHALKSPYFAEFEYEATGIAIGAERYPILKMDWVLGAGLIPYIEANLGDATRLANLTRRFIQLVLSLHDAGIAHGDLQHGNILVHYDELMLVDYDGMFVPALAGMKSNELGHRNYQHPQRDATFFDARLDNFSTWSIYTSLLCLSRAPQFWHILGAGEECLLFKAEDYAKPDQSKAFRLLNGESDTEIKRAIRFFNEILVCAPKDVPSMAEMG